MLSNIIKKVLLFGIIIMFIFSSQISFVNAQIKKISDKNIDLNNSDYDLLIITPQKYSKQLEPLIDHKNDHNVRTILKTTEFIYQSYKTKGRDKPEQIKYFIKDANETLGIRYVLLVGGARQIPVRYCNNPVYFTHVKEKPTFITELYYADIKDKNGNFSSWDTNNDGVYAEWYGKEAQDKDIDLYPDVCVGRLACQNKFEVKIMVDKIIDYETNTYGQAWFNRMVVISGDNYPNYPGYEGEENTQQALDYMPDNFEKEHLWTSDGTLSSWLDIIKSVNKGCGFVYSDGRGSPISWVNSPPEQYNYIKFSIFHIRFLFNGHKLPIWVSSGCRLNQFDVTPLNLLKHPIKSLFTIRDFPFECWGWRLTRKIGGGSIATLAKTQQGLTKEDKNSWEGGGGWLRPRFFYHVGMNNVTILGEAMKNAIYDYLDTFPIDWNTPCRADSAIDAKTVQQWVLLGDPSLKIGGYPN